MKKKETRCRNWTVILYPESAPKNWIDIIQSQRIEWVQSPLHDKDLTAVGEQKKAHYHLLLMFGGVKSYEQVKEITDLLNCPRPERVHNSKSLVRYMLHMDDANKAQYNVSDLKAYGGVDVAEMLRPSSSERYTLLKEMLDYIEQENITEFIDIVMYASKNREDDWFPLLADNSAYFIGQVIKSQRFKNYCTVDKNTGEVLDK